MSERLVSHLAELRHRRGLAQGVLAERVGVSRQSLSSLEGGHSVPSTALALRLARALDCRVEELFALEEEDGGRLEVEVAATGAELPTKGERVLLASVNERWVAHPLSTASPLSLMLSADGVVATRPRTSKGGAARARVKLLQPAERLGDTLLCSGCAPALGILAARAGDRGQGRVLWLERSSGAALELLRRGQVQIAGAHLYDDASGEFNVPIVKRLFPDQSMLVVTFASWEAGLVVAADNPLGIRGLTDLARADVTVARRQPGSGAEGMLERLLARAGIAVDRLRRSGPVAGGHLDTARAVAMGAADVGVAIPAVARAFGLAFFPLVEERFDLVLPRERAREPAVARLLDTLSARAFRRELDSLGGYQSRAAGSTVTVAP